MGFTVENPFTFLHRKLLRRVILSDQYEDNSIHPDLAAILFGYHKAKSSCYYSDDHFVVQFEVEEFIGDVKCCLNKKTIKGPSNDSRKDMVE